MTRKELKIRIRNGTNHFEVYFEGGGEVPQILTGLYTTENFAQRAIETYKITKRPSTKGTIDAASSSK